MKRAIALLLLGMTGPALAQEQKASDEVAPAEEAAAIAFFNRPGTIRVVGAFLVPAGGEVVGDVGALGGPLTVAGRIRGRVVVINGDVRLEPGAVVAGDLTVIGGALTGLDGATVEGAVEVYRAPLRVWEEDGQLVASATQRQPEVSAGRAFGFGRTDLTLGVRRSYNRVEGLPLLVGPRFEFGGSNPTRLETMLIYRTESGMRFDADELGYVVRLEQSVGGRRAARVGVQLHSEIEPIEAWGLSDRENSLATFLFHRDYRDHYERQGWAVYLRLAPPAQPYDLTLEYREDDHRVVTAQGPWALFDNHEEWRPQPIIAEGPLRSAAVRLSHDTRNDEVDPSTGWLLRAELERGLGGGLIHPVTLNPGGGGPLVNPERPARDEFTSAFLDLRRYVRVGPGSRVGLRVLAAGSVDGRALPPQRQHALGGEGSLPGYPLLSFDCGARSASTGGLFSHYGCDRVVLAQLEYSDAVPLVGDRARMLGRRIGLDAAPRWVLFLDAGRAWTELDARDGRLAGQDDFAVDAGLGLRVGQLGVYWAVPLSGRRRGVNFFLRIGSRL